MLHKCRALLMLIPCLYTIVTLKSNRTAFGWINSTPITASHFNEHSSIEHILHSANFVCWKYVKRAKWRHTHTHTHTDKLPLKYYVSCIKNQRITLSNLTLVARKLPVVTPLWCHSSATCRWRRRRQRQTCIYSIWHINAQKCHVACRVRND